MCKSMYKLLIKIEQKIKSIRYHHLNKFVFIHINKTGGSSVEKALNIPFEHKTALEKIEEIGQGNWSSKLTFTVIRNPWDKVVSHYHYRVQTNQTNLRDKPIAFKKWVQRTYGNQDPFYYDNPKMFMPQIDWISDKTGNILVDKIVRFENLDNEFIEVMKILGKNVTLPHVKSSKRRKYVDYYDEETVTIIQNWFRQDIKHFGYEFNE